MALLYYEHVIKKLVACISSHEITMALTAAQKKEIQKMRKDYRDGQRKAVKAFWKSWNMKEENFTNSNYGR